MSERRITTSSKENGTSQSLACQKIWKPAKTATLKFRLKNLELEKQKKTLNFKQIS